MIYGHRWSSQYGKQPAAVWVSGLGDLSADEIKRGMEGCVMRPDGWPPSLPEFRAMCKPVVAVIPACHRPAQPFAAALPKPAKITAPGDARARLAAIRAKITAGKLRPRAVEDAAYAETKARQRSAVWVKPSWTE